MQIDFEKEGLMQLKMIRAPHAGQKDMVVQSSAGTHVAELGKVLEVSDTAGHEIMAQWGHCFEFAGGAQAQTAKVAVSVEADAEAEATKSLQAKDYKNKKV
jgi:hypothetical protein